MRTIQARFVIRQTNGYHVVRVRRCPRHEFLDPRSIPEGTSFNFGDKIEVKRVTNNPYLVFVAKVA